MLTQLSIRHFAIVDHLELELRPGMTAITGETGAGKSIMLDAIALVLEAGPTVPWCPPIKHERKLQPPWSFAITL